MHFFYFQFYVGFFWGGGIETILAFYCLKKDIYDEYIFIYGLHFLSFIDMRTDFGYKFRKELLNIKKVVICILINSM